MSEMREKRTFSKEEKLAILKEASAHGVKPTLEKHGLYAATYTVGEISLRLWEK